MTKIIEYITQPGGNVNKAIEEGYQPYGSPVIGKSGVIYQAMVKYEDNTKSVADSARQLHQQVDQSLRDYRQAS